MPSKRSALSRQPGEILQRHRQGAQRVPSLGGDDALAGVAQHEVDDPLLLAELADQPRVRRTWSRSISGAEKEAL
jgi:hypothetical protein